MRKKAHHNEESCLNLLHFFQYKIYNVDCTARKIEVEGKELEIVSKLWAGLFLLYTLPLRNNVTAIPRI